MNRSKVRRSRAGILTAAAVVCLGLSACGSDGGSADGGSRDSGPSEQEARDQVTAYLEAMKTKDVDQGREQFCESMREQFDRNATGAEGDFGDHFTLENYKIDSVESAPDDGRRVSTTLTLRPKGVQQTADGVVHFTVVTQDGGPCISDERADEQQQNQ